MYGMLYLQQFVSYAVIVAYYNSGGDVASAVFILLCLQYAVNAKNPMPSDTGLICCTCNILWTAVYHVKQDKDDTIEF